MKLNLAILAAVLSFCLVLETLLQDQIPTSAPQTAIAARTEKVPAFSIQTLDGKSHPIDMFKGRIIILNFWASWCAPCVSEFPLLLDFAAEHSDITLIALSSDKDEKAVRRFLSALPQNSQKHLTKTNILIAHDKDKTITSDLFQTVSLPETIIIDASQHLKTKIIGMIASPEDLKKAVFAQ